MAESRPSSARCGSAGPRREPVQRWLYLYPGTAGVGIAFGNVYTTMGATHSNGEIRVNTTSGLLPTDFIERDSGGQVPNRSVSTIAFYPNSNTKACVGLSDFTGGAPGNIYCTADFAAAAMSPSTR